MTEQNGVERSSATDELRRLLDERGVEWDYGIGGAYTTEFSANGVMLNFRDWGDGVICSTILTPEQAIAATLGPREQPSYDELIEALRRDWDIEASWDGLRRFWYVGLTDEGVRKRDEREATLGSGTCHPIISDNLTESEGTGDAWADCSECGQLLFVLTDPSSKPPNYCPNCGAKVVDE